MKHELLLNEKCNMCGSRMQYDKVRDFWKCHDCGSEFWPPLETEKEKQKELQAAFENNQYVSRSMVPGAVEPGGSKSAGKRKKKKAPKSSDFDRFFMQT